MLWTPQGVGSFKIIDSDKTGRWVLVEHYLGDDQNPAEQRWVNAAQVHSQGVQHAFDEADPVYDPNLDEDKTDPMPIQPLKRRP